MCGAVRLKGFMVKKKNLHQLIVLFDRETPKVREESTLPCFANGESYSVYAFYDDYNDDCFKHDDDDTNNDKEDYKNKNDYVSFI